MVQRDKMKEVVKQLAMRDSCNGIVSDEQVGQNLSILEITSIISREMKKLSSRKIF